MLLYQRIHAQSRVGWGGDWLAQGYSPDTILCLATRWSLMSPQSLLSYGDRHHPLLPDLGVAFLEIGGKSR